MKFSGVIVALVAASPLASAIPFRMSDMLGPVARSAEPAQPAAPVFPQYRSTNLTARAINETLVDKRSFIPGVVPVNATEV